MMGISVVPFQQLESSHIDAWSNIQSTLPTDSPFFGPEFVAMVASVRDDVSVGVMQEEGKPVGFFPFHRDDNGCGEPVGADINQFQCAVIAPSVAWTVDELLRGCDLRSWKFDHVPTTQCEFEKHAFYVGDSPCIDLSDGFESYCKQKRSEGKAIEQAMRKMRKLEREVGLLRFELHDDSAEAFQKLLEWKSEQHRRTSVFDAFQVDWIVEVLDRARTKQSESFSGLMSSLYAGEDLVAVHLGIANRTVAHIWYPAFNTDFGKHSPGITLLLKLAEALADRGVKRIDFAARQQIYKTRFMNGAVPVYRGVAELSRLRSCVRRNATLLREQVRATPLAAPIRAPVRMIRSVGRWLSNN